jgi:hypothetical protein
MCAYIFAYVLMLAIVNVCARSCMHLWKSQLPSEVLNKARDQKSWDLDKIKNLKFKIYRLEVRKRKEEEEGGSKIEFMNECRRRRDSESRACVCGWRLVEEMRIYNRLKREIANVSLYLHIQ